MFKKFKSKLAVVGASLAPMAAFAAGGSETFPTDLADLAAYATTKGGIAVALSVVVTGIILALRFGKLPRRA